MEAITLDQISIKKMCESIISKFIKEQKKDKDNQLHKIMDRLDLIDSYNQMLNDNIKQMSYIIKEQLKLHIDEKMLELENKLYNRFNKNKNKKSQLLYKPKVRVNIDEVNDNNNKKDKSNKLYKSKEESKEESEEESEEELEEEDKTSDNKIKYHGTILTYKTHNEKYNINTNGTSLQGDINISYDEICNKLGLPTKSDEYKVDAVWEIEFSDETIGTIYNWKNGKNYRGAKGIPTNQIEEWNIGGNESDIVDKIHQIFE